MVRINAFMAATMVACAASPLSAETDRAVLPMPDQPFSGSIERFAADSTPSPLTPAQAPAGAPNVLVFMSDDVGFAMASIFGGPVPTPNFARVAAMGQRYNRFHTTGICSPSRAALLTGRNHHNTGNGYISDLHTGFPGYYGRIGSNTATIAQVLRLNGYNTAMFGKHHNVPRGETSAAGPFDNWPTGLGFEYFFGFISGDTDQWSPSLYRGITRLPDEAVSPELLDRRLALDLINWVHNQKSAAPDKPFFAYLSPGSTHAPHQAWPEDIARFHGRFDAGWDAMRTEIWQRQLAEGIIPPETLLTPRPDGIPAWDSLPAEEQAFAARTMEVAAAQLAYQDEQFGLVLDELERMGILQNTLIAIVGGDNGASAEGETDGTLNEVQTLGGIEDTPAWRFANIENLGGPDTYPNYPAGWAWAMNTPLRWTKQVASMLGGIRNGMILSSPGQVAQRGSVCEEFGHLVDIVPTILEAADLPAPRSVNGIEQIPIDGQSLLPSLRACEPQRERTQYFEIAGNAGLFHNGWFASMDVARLPWESQPPAGLRPEPTWTLYNLDQDFSQSTDLSASEPDRMQDMIALWESEAERNHVFPLDYLSSAARNRPIGEGRKFFELWGTGVSLPALSEPFLTARSFDVEADVRLDRANASGVILAVGSYFGGWSLYLDRGNPVFHFARTTDPANITRIVSDTALPIGASRLTLQFRTQGPGQPAQATLLMGGAAIASGNISNSYMLPAGLGETIDVGRDTGVPVTEYMTSIGAIEGDVPYVAIRLDP